MINPLIFICFISPFFFSTQVLVAVDSLYPNQSILDNGGTLISASQTFELGFFSPWNSNNRYIGIWFKNVPIQTVVWVANRDNPVTDSSGVITITTIGNIIISSNQTNIIWNSNSSSTRGSNPVLQLLDSGNLVLRNINSDNYFWQSFDHPCDTLIPGMKLGWNLKTNQEWYLTSWRSSEDPATGGYTYRLNPHGLPEIVLRLGSRVQFRSGPWDGVRFGGSPKQSHNSVLKPIYVFDEENAFYAFQNYDVSIISRFVLNQSGMVQFLTWRQRRNEWVVIATMQEDICDNYAQCGNHGVCTLNGNPICDCLDGFVPRLPQDWERQDWSGGCYRRTPLNCSATEGFKKFSNLKLPDNSNFLVNSTSVSTPVECEEACLRNCSCTAYAVTEVSVCAVWFGDLVDIRTFSEDGQDIYIRMPASELVESSSDRAKRTALIASVTVVVFILGLIIWYVLRKRNIAKERDMASQRRDIPNPNNYQSIGEEDIELPLFDLLIISAATNDFNLTNKIGEGGFGPVYKGILSTGQEIAVKRLSKDSGQGLEEFKNEVILIAKLQHRNLVRLLGCCIHGDERMLIYEHMPNKSLDLFIFDRTRAMILDWAKRLNIIVGIARGLLYLHRDSRLRIIHRDLKVSNILLDGEMNPKISDFGLARIFGGDKFQENTSRIMGTYGYMSPEYAIDGLFSVKSDVFSFGVLTLEIVSGNKNRGFYHPDHDLNLLGHAWRLWNDGNALNLVDASMGSSFLAPEVLRCIHVGLLCVQQRPEDRPTMSNVLLMLDVEYPLVPQPKQPGFYLERSFTDTDSSSTGKRIYTPNEVTLTQLQGR